MTVELDKIINASQFIHRIQQIAGPIFPLKVKMGRETFNLDPPPNYNAHLMKARGHKIVVEFYTMDN